MDLGLAGRGATERTGVDSLIAGLLRTAVWYSGVLSLSVSVDVVARQRHAAPTTRCGAAADFGNCGAPAAMELADGPRAGGARGHRGTGVDSLIAGLLRTAVWVSGVLSLSVSVDVVARQRHAAPTTSGNKAAASQSPFKLVNRRVRSNRTSTRRQLDCARTPP